MIVFVNGAFGIGKSTVADLLVTRLPNSLLFDAEFVGYLLRRVIPASEQTSDFQDLPMWRILTVTTARLLREQYGWTLVMPMTIWHRPYFDEILGGLRAAGEDVHHFCLTATMPTLAARIRASNEAVEWRLAHAERCLTAFQSPTFATQIPTDSKTPEAIAEKILTLLPQGV
jgi:AAA domain